MNDQKTFNSFDELYYATYHDVLHYVICHCSHIEDVKDIVQNVYLSILKINDISKINKAYILGITKHKVKDYYRFQYKTRLLSLISTHHHDLQFIDTIPSDINIEDNFIKEEDIQFIWNYLKSKNIIISQVFYLYYYKDQSIKDIANELHTSESNVKNYLYRTLKNSVFLCKGMVIKMTRNQTIKKVFDNEFNIENMKHQILIKNKRKKSNYLFQISLSFCLLLLCSLYFIQNKDTQISNDKIHINQITNINITKIDAEIQFIPINDIFIPWLESLNNIAIPDDLNLFHGHAVYTKNSQSNDYDVLNCYVYEYSHESLDKSIRIAFSDKNHPIRDYFFETKGQKSIINNIELFIYQNKNSYFTEFQYQNYYFDIETKNISIEELTQLLHSIIK